jgi:pyruvate/2-oxoglutarate dehydrogenase complex dihydrolipoamide dehydrogenase (E3) component
MKMVVDAETKHILGAAIPETGGDEAIHGILDAMNACITYTGLKCAVPIHPTVSGLIPTILGELRARMLSEGPLPHFDHRKRSVG